MDWNQVVISIPTVASRSEYLRELLAQLVPLQALGAQMVVHMHVEGTGSKEDFPATMQMAFDRGKPWILALEDDITLSPGFETSALAAIAHAESVGAGAITMFTRSKNDLAMLTEGRRYAWQPPRSLMMLQAIAVQRPVMEGFAQWAPSWFAANPKKTRIPNDVLLAGWLHHRKAKLLRHVPSLVQHRRGPSSVGGRSSSRRSQTYELAFGDSP
jgi:GR25 family glycosyltransferase involved in LPS biosynthesis